MNDGLLIDLVHSYPHLYDKKRADFKDAMKKNNSWVEIARLVKCSKEDVMAGWKFLREKYIRCGKTLPSGSEVESQNLEWEYYSALKWLDNYITKRKTKSCWQSLQTSDKAQELSETLEGQDDSSSTTAHILDHFESETQFSDMPMEKSESPLLSPVASTSRSTTTLNLTTPSKRKRETNKLVTESLQDIGATMKNVVNNLAKKKSEDQDELFVALAGPPILVNSADICPQDSEAVEGLCKCNLDLCEAPPCDMFLHLIRNGTNTPGNCCPLYACDNCTSDTIENGTCACGAEAFLNDKGRCECMDQSKSLIDDVCVCDPNKCELPHLCDKHSVPVRVTEGCCIKTHCKPCPEDSYPTDFQSDEIEDKCVCFPCPEIQCNDTHAPQILRKGRNVPHQCCDLYTCVPKETPEQECFVNNITYTNGQEWINQDEQNCTCINGITLCNEHDAKDIFVKHCLVNNTAYPHLATWQEDICTNCTCYDGHQKCITHLCNITESKIKKYEDCLYNDRTYNHSSNWTAEDLCTTCTCNNGMSKCDTQACNNTSTIDTMDNNNNNCPPLDNCKRFCKNGYKVNRKGCEICKCKVPERTVEKYALLETYMRDHNLSETGALELLNQRISRTEKETTTPTSTPPDQPKGCMFTSYLVLCIIAFCSGIVFGFLIHFCWKRKHSCDYRPVSKTMDNNNLPIQGHIKYISEKSPLKT